MTPFEIRQIGEQFLRFTRLQNGASVQEEELRRRYTQFKDRFKGECPDFRLVLITLKKAGIIRMRGEDVTVLFWAQAPDQWPIWRASQQMRMKKEAAQQLLVLDECQVMYEDTLRSKIVSELKKNRNEVTADKNGICLTSDFPSENGKIISKLIDTFEGKIRLYVKNTGTEKVKFTSYFLLHPCKPISLSDGGSVSRNNPLLLQPGDRYEVLVSFSCRHLSVYPATLAFEFKLHQQPSPFYIVRFVEFHRITASGQEWTEDASDRPRSPTVQPNSAKNSRKLKRFSGPQLKTKVPLVDFKVPGYMKHFIRSLKQPSVNSSNRNLRELLEKPLSWEIYRKKLQLLLYLEELQIIADTNKNNMADSGMKRNREVPLSEKTYQRNIGEGNEFLFGRLTWNIQHRAVVLASEKPELEKVLFPDMSLPSNRNAELPELKLLNPLVKENKEQYRAVQHIVAGSSRPAPYLIFGPPGTGKTVTMVEAILQIRKTRDSCHILVCAHTNSAVDLLCEEILRAKVKVFRMYAKSVEPDSVRDELKEHANIVGGEIYFPAKETLMRHKIIATTLYSASRLITGGIPAGHFTHVFVDEAGQAMETECLIPLAGLLDPKSGQVVLAGDPKQLGPIVSSPFAKENGMGVSLLERLMDRLPEQGTDSSCFTTKLLQNYRSHPDILAIPNKLFYGGNLVASLGEAVYSLCSWEKLPQKGFPVIFHEVMGVEQASRPSFFNIMEVDVLMNYVKTLLDTVEPGDIGIITPYKTQVLKVREALQRQQIVENSEDIKVGSVEEYQGLEKKVILLSTVRSSTDYLQIEKPLNTDFIKDEKRFNVALTRAQALLIVVGNPVILKTNKNWAEFIQFCKDKNGYISSEE